MSSVNIETRSPLPSSIGTTGLVYMSSRASAVKRRCVFAAVVARFRSFLISLRSNKVKLILTIWKFSS